MEGQYNKRSPAVKRLMREAQELANATYQYYAQPLEENLFEWHFTVRGPADSDFEGGIYHGRIVLPTEYPMKPPNIIVLTPNGRFEVGKKICLSISGHHPESWQPSWSIRTALLAIIGFMPTPGQGTIGSLDFSSEERKMLAKRSVTYQCDTCGQTSLLLKSETDEEEGSKKSDDEKEMREIMEQMDLKGEDEVGEDIKNEWNCKNEFERKIAEDPALSVEEKTAKLERKRASLAAQQRFRDRLNLGPAPPVNKPERNSSAPSTSPVSRANGEASPTPTQMPGNEQQQVNHQTPARQQQQLEQNHGWGLTDYLVCVLVLAIGLLLYRRLNNGLVGAPTSGNRPDHL